MLNTWMPDDCCGPHLSAASLAGQLDSVVEWECPECGCRWTATVVNNLAKHWAPLLAVSIF
jgi:hypothetical protein